MDLSAVLQKILENSPTTAIVLFALYKVYNKSVADALRVENKWEEQSDRNAALVEKTTTAIVNNIAMIFSLKREILGARAEASERDR